MTSQMNKPVNLPLVGSMHHTIFINDPDEYKNLDGVVRNFYASVISEKIMKWIISATHLIHSPGSIQRYKMTLNRYQKGQNPTYGDLLGRIPTMYGHGKMGGIIFY